MLQPRLIHVALCAAFCVASWSSVAVAEEPPPAELSVAEALQKAQAHYDAGEFRAAAPLLLRAYDELQAPKILYRLGNVYSNLGNFRRARHYFELYLEFDPESDLRGRVEAKVKTLERLESASQSWASIEIEPGGGEVYYHNDLDHPLRTFSEKKIPLAAGPHTLVVLADGHRAELNFEVEPGETIERIVRFESDGSFQISAPTDTEEVEEVATTEPEPQTQPEPEPTAEEAEPEAEPEPVAEAEPEPDERADGPSEPPAIREEEPASRGHALRWIGIGLTAGGGIALGIGAYNDLVRIPATIVQQEAVVAEGEANGDDAGTIEAELAPLRNQRQGAVTGALVGYAVGGVLVSAGIVMIILDAARGSEPKQARVVPIVTPTRVGVSVAF